MGGGSDQASPQLARFWVKIGAVLNLRAPLLVGSRSGMRRRSREVDRSDTHRRRQGNSTVTQVRELYLSVADTAAELLAAPEVADGWREPSALSKLSVQGLAGHLAGQVFFIPTVLAEPVPTEPAISIHEYYARVSWIGSDLDSPFNQAIRSGGVIAAIDDKLSPRGIAQLAASRFASGNGNYMSEVSPSRSEAVVQATPLLGSGESATCTSELRTTARRGRTDPP